MSTRDLLPLGFETKDSAFQKALDFVGILLFLIIGVGCFTSLLIAISDTQALREKQKSIFERVPEILHSEGKK